MGLLSGFLHVPIKEPVSSNAELKDIPLVDASVDGTELSEKRSDDYKLNPDNYKIEPLPEFPENVDELKNINRTMSNEEIDYCIDILTTSPTALKFVVGGMLKRGIPSVLEIPKTAILDVFKSFLILDIFVYKKYVDNDFSKKFFRNYEKKNISEAKGSQANNLDGKGDSI